MAMVTRTLNNTDGPITSPSGAALASKQVIFQLVDFEKRQPVSLFDAATGGEEYVVGTPITATTDAIGVFSVALWPNTRGERATLYKVSLPGTTIKPFYISVAEGVGPITLIQAKAAVEAVAPQTLSLFEALLNNILEVVGTATSVVTTTVNGLMSFADKVKLDFLWGTVTHVESFASLNAAVAAIGATKRTLVFSSDVTVTANITIPANIELLPLNGAKIDHGAYTIDYAGSTVRWPLAQVLNGTGAVRLTNCSESYPEWWGIDGVADEVQILAAIKAHGDSATTITGGKVVLVGRYNISSTILIRNKSIEIEGRGFGNVVNSVPSYLKWTGVADAPLIRIQSCRGSKIKNLRLIGNKLAKPVAAIEMYVENDGVGGDDDISQNSFNVFENIWIGHYDGLDTAQTGAVGDYQFTNGIYFNGDNTGNNYNTFRNIRIGMANNGVNIAGNQYGQNTFDGLWATFCYYGFATKAPAIGHDWFFDNNQEADILIQDDARLMLYDYSSERSYKMATCASGGRLSIIGGTFSVYSGSQGTVFDGYGGNPASLYLEDFALQQEQGSPYVGTPRFTLRSDNNEDVKAFIGRRCRGITFAMLDMNTNAGNALSRHTVDLEVIGTYGSANDSLVIKNLLVGPSKSISATSNILSENLVVPWTPVLTAATPGDLSIVYSAQVGTIKRVGNTAFANFNITCVPTFTTAASYLKVTGLPIAANSTVGNQNNGPLTFTGINKAGYTQINARLDAGSDFMYLESSGMGQSTLAVITASEVTSGQTLRLRGSIVYQL